MTEGTKFIMEIGIRVEIRLKSNFGACPLDWSLLLFLQNSVR
jgi:hypothetical protein